MEDRAGGPGGVTEWERDDTVDQCFQDEALSKRLGAVVRPSLPQAAGPPVENDLIAGFFARTGHAPTLQFGAEAEAPVD